MENDLSSGKLIKVMSALCFEPWLILPGMHQTLTDIAQKHCAGGDAEQAQHELAAAMPANKGATTYAVEDGVAIIPMEGIVGRKFSNVLKSSGVTSVDVFQRLVDTAANDEAVQSILLVFDSPGGVAMGVQEAGNTIAEAKRKKYVMAYVDGQAASAAYWMASQASVVLAGLSSDVGGVGCYMAVIDASRAAEMQGYHVDMIKSGYFKGAGYPGTQLTERQREVFQMRVDHIAANFRAAVRAGREREISDDVMQGQTFTAGDAMKLGLIDGIVSLSEAKSTAKTSAKNIKRG